MIIVSSFSEKHVGVLGLGRSGLAATRALVAGGACVSAWDDDEKQRKNAKLAGLELTNLYESDWSKIDLLVLSPGISDKFPEPHKLAKCAKDAGCEIICDVDLLAREVTQSYFIGVSGTNGKSTTTALIGHILQESLRVVEIGGNFGIPALELSSLGNDGTYVLELSSYQLERVPSLQLDIMVLLNIFPDHLDRHGGMDGYVEAKKNLFQCARAGSKAIIGMEDSYSRSICMELMIEQKIKEIVPISSTTRSPGGVYVENGILIDDLDNQQEVVMDLNKLKVFPGQHNFQNVAAAYAAVNLAGIKLDQIIKGIGSFGGLAHRQELVLEVNGVVFINDSKATNTQATAKALSCYENIQWIAGGQFKESNISSLESVLDNVHHAYIIGQDVDQLSDLLKPHISISKCENLELAFSQASQKAMSSPPGVVLLSPACASFDQFKNFEDRGEAFRKLVKNLGEVK